MTGRHWHKLLWSLACSAVLLQACAALRPAGKARSLSARVVHISEEYANINTDVSEAALTAAGIVHGSIFRARSGDHDLDVFLGKQYSDVERGKWVGLIEEDGMLQLAISFGNAATQIGCQVGDTITLTPTDGR